MNTLPAFSPLQTNYDEKYQDLPRADVIGLLAARPDLIGHILSCNNAFRGLVDGGEEAPQLWCGRCPKCAFTFLMLAAVLSPEALTSVFDVDMLDQPELIDAFAHQAGHDITP